MPAIAPASNATPSLQRALLRTRVEQAQREADRAEANARSLRTQADQAEQESRDKQGTADTLASQYRSAGLTYAPPGRRATGAEVPAQTQDFLERLYGATRQKFADSGNPLKTDANAAPVINSQGQATGRIVNIRAA